MGSKETEFRWSAASWKFSRSSRDTWLGAAGTQPKDEAHRAIPQRRVCNTADQKRVCLLVGIKTWKWEFLWGNPDGSDLNSCRGWASGKGRMGLPECLVSFYPSNQIPTNWWGYPQPACLLPEGPETFCCLVSSHSRPRGQLTPWDLTDQLQRLWVFAHKNSQN